LEFVSWQMRDPPIDILSGAGPTLPATDRNCEKCEAMVESRLIPKLPDRALAAWRPDTSASSALDEQKQQSTADASRTDKPLVLDFDSSSAAAESTVAQAAMATEPDGASNPRPHASALSPPVPVEPSTACAAQVEEPIYIDIELQIDLS